MVAVAVVAMPAVVSAAAGVAAAACVVVVAVALVVVGILVLVVPGLDLLGVLSWLLSQSFFERFQAFAVKLSPSSQTCEGPRVQALPISSVSYVCILLSILPFSSCRCLS